MKWTLQREYFAGAILIVALVLFSGLLEYRSLQSTVSSLEWVNHTADVLQEIESLEAAIYAAEGSARGYAITHDENTLVPYYSGLERSGVSLQHLRELTLDNPVQQRRLDRLVSLWNSRQAVLEDLVRSGATTPRQDLIEEGNRLMETVHQELRDMAYEESHLLQRRNADAAAGRRQTELVVVLSIILALLTVIGGTFILNNDFNKRSKAETALRESEERFRLLVREVREYAILMLDPGGHILSWNLGAQRITGYSADEVLGKPMSIFYLEEDVTARKPERALRAAASEGRFEEEGRRRRKDGSQFWANVVIAPLRDDQGNLRGFSKVTRDVTERRRAQEALRDMSGRLLRAEDRERRRLAREFHDGTSQILASMQLQLALLQDVVPEANASAQESLTELTNLVDRCGTEIRTLSHVLHPPILDDAGLGSAIRSYAEGFGRRSGIAVTTDIPEDLPRFSSDIETALFRITQEALANIHRHSGSSTASIRVALAQGRIELEIQDQGHGIPDEVLNNPARLGVGVRGMTERVRLLGGEIHVESGEGGTTVRAELPSETPVALNA
jgi:PAS domain S-box-containing protein